MSFFDQAKELYQGAAGQKAVALLSGLLEQHGGLRGLVGQLQSRGLGEAARSWVGTGQNLPVSPEQVKEALGSGTVARLAASAGIDPQQASEQLARFLPGVIDQLTPDGQIPAAEPSPLSGVTQALSQLFQKKEGGSHVA